MSAISANKHIRVTLISVNSIMLDETAKGIIEKLKVNGTNSSNIFVTDTTFNNQNYTNAIDVLNPTPKAIEALLITELPEDITISLNIITESKLKC